MTEIMELEMPTLKEVLKEAGGNEQLLKEQTRKLRLWLNQQLHLPQDISDERLRFFICSTKFNLEKIKKRLDSYYTLRNLFPEISNMDPLSDDMIQCYKYLYLITLPKLMPQKYRVIMTRILNPDSSIFDISAVLKYSFLSLEILAEEDLVTSDFIIIDAINFRIGHVFKFNLNVLKKINIYLEAHGRRIKAIYIINSSDVIGLLMSIMKSVMNVKLFNRIHIYTSGIESLYDIIPKSILPIDYGGEQPSMDTIAAMWRAKMAARREWFLQQEKVSVNESLRSNSVINPDDLFGVSGTFQKLDID